MFECLIHRYQTRACPFAGSKVTPQPNSFRDCSNSPLRRTLKALFGLILTTVPSSINASTATSQSPGFALKQSKNRITQRREIFVLRRTQNQELVIFGSPVDAL